MDKDKLFGVKHCEPLDIPAYSAAGVKLTVRALIESDCSKVLELMKEARENEGSSGLPFAKAVAMLLGDESGAPCFQESEAQAILERIPISIQAEIVKAGLKYNMLAKVDDEAEKKS